MKIPTLGILKQHPAKNKVGYSWYGADYNFEIHQNKKNRPPLPTIDLNIHPEIKTEKQLLKMIFDRFGEGNYLIRGFRGGKRKDSIFTFWRGEITSRGFKFNRNSYNNKEISKLKRERYRELSEGDMESAKITKEIIEEAIKENKENNKTIRYGFLPFLKPSGKRGYFNLWEDPDIIKKDNSYDWGLEKKETLKKINNWGESNTKKNFEKW